MRALAGVAKIVVALFAINFVAIVVVVLVMMGKGMLTGDSVAAAVEALRGGPAALEPAATQPTGPDLPPPPISLADHSRATALVRAELAGEIEGIRRRAEMVERARNRLEEERTAFEAQRKAFLESMDETLQARRQAGLRQVLKTLAALKAPRGKTLIEKLPDEELAVILVGLEPRLRGKVIDEFKTPEEVERIRSVMDLIRQGAGSKAPAKMASS